MRLRHVVLTALGLLAASGARVGSPTAAGTKPLLPVKAVPAPGESTPTRRPRPARVQLDRLKWSPDGNQLAFEARLLDGPATSIDTLIVDLTAGSLLSTAPQAIAFALSGEGARLAVVSHYTLWSGPAVEPGRLVPLLRLDPTRDVVERLGFNHAGDTLYVALRRDNLGWIDVTAWPLNGAASGPGRRFSAGAAADSAWAGLAADEPVVVRPNPFPGFYQAIRDNLFFLERSDLDTPNGGAQWFFDLHHRNRTDGSEQIMAKRIAPFAFLVSPDSTWLAIAGVEYRADYGGGVIRRLWLASPDGQEYFSVQPIGERDAGVAVTGMSWRAGRLWYSTPEGLWVLSPYEGRSRLVPFGPGVPDWARELPPPTRVLTSVLPDTHPDSTSAVAVRSGLLRSGLPAWVMGPADGPFRVAVGAASDAATLRTTLTPVPGERSMVEDFPPEWRLAAAEGLSMAYDSVRDPGGTREAWLTAVGPPGLLAGELWLTERHGARRIRLLKAMRAQP